MLTLTIDGTPCPLVEGQSINLGYDSSLLSDIESARTGRRATLSVMATPETDRLFGNASDPLTAEHFHEELHSGEVAVDGVAIFSGAVRLVAARRRHALRTYEVEIIGGAARWAKEAARRRIADAGVSFATVFTPELICAGWESDQPVKFLPVHKDSYELTNSSVSLLPAEKIMMTDDYWPFISVAALTEAIFRDAGYTVESRFFEGDLFRSLYMSGAYASSGDIAGARRNMDFRAGRTSDATATADFFGRVYLSPSVADHTVGNIVDCTDEYIYDGGVPEPSGFYSRNGCFALENGEAVFRPLTAVTVGFEYSIAYVTDHVIASRTALRGFDTLHLGNGTTVPFTIANRYADHRDNLQPDHGYQLIIFDFNDKYTYRFSCLLNGSSRNIATLTARMTPVTVPAAASASDPVLMRAPKGSTNFEPCTEDWALYSGYISERGKTELEITVRTPPERLSPASVKRFNQIFFDGAQSGMSFTLLKRTTVRPLFTSAIGYGSTVRFADIAALGVRQHVFLEALAHMFNLRFCTDEAAKKVYIEPYADFFNGGIVDWSGRADSDTVEVLADPSRGVHESQTLAYRAGDGTVSRFNTANGDAFGEWVFKPLSLATLEGDKRSENPLFAPTMVADRVYADALSAKIMQVCDRDDDDTDDSQPFVPRIVRYCGLHSLPEGERWGYPFSRAEYPFAAFHYTGDSEVEGFTLCFEDRDGLTGLNRYHLAQLSAEGCGPRLTLSLHIHPEEIAGLFDGSGDRPCVRSLFRLDAGQQPALYILESIEDYDPAKPLARCTFLKVPRSL